MLEATFRNTATPKTVCLEVLCISTNCVKAVKGTLPLTPLLLINHPYQLPPFTTNNSIIPAQSTYLAVSLHIRHSQAKCMLVTGIYCPAVHYCTHRSVILGDGGVYTVVLHYWAVFQSDHLFCCYGSMHISIIQL